ncbi:MAG: thiamine pyrophosphate-dependent enzyme [Terracidiphilus sp.]
MMQESETLSASPTAEAGTATAILIREVEQKLLGLFAEGKLFGTIHTCIGQEWVGVAVAGPLSDGDYMISNHRCHGHFLARTGNVNGLIAEIMGKQSGVCGGRGGSQHLCDVKHGFFSNGVQGGMMPIAAGLALSLKLKGTDHIAVIFVGDGTLGEGVVYEAFNIASKWELPILIVLENNEYAQSTPQVQTLAGEIEARAAAFGIQTSRCNTWDTERLCVVAEESVQQVRRTQRPLFLQVDCDRLMAHSKGDDDRDPREIDAYKMRDPLNIFFCQNPAKGAIMQQYARRIVAEAVVCAERDTYGELHESKRSLPSEAAPHWTAAVPFDEKRHADAIRESLLRNMRRDPRILLLGEDIESPYGGAFKVTKGLSDEFPGRVLNTPISEATIVGMGNGLALGGFIPVCEIMFGDFLCLAADQIINHASKFHQMYNGQVQVPMVIRTPMGGRRGYGPTHSQSLEKHFLGLPQTRVLALHNCYDSGIIYDKILSSIDRTTIVVENKQLYATRLLPLVPAGFALDHSDEPYPTTRLRPLEPPQVTVFCYGGIMPYAEQAAVACFDDDEITVEVICPIQIYPLNPWPVIESLKQSRLLLVVEEGIGFAAVGSELIAQITEHAPDVMRRAKRIGSLHTPIPACGRLEEELLPNCAMILAAIQELARLD